jgi:L-asparaginase II
VKLIRGDFVESVHRVSVAVVDSTGRLRHGTGDPYFFTSLRSSAKPFQILPLLEDGLDEHFGFTPEELTLMAGSHSSQDFHVRVMESILEKIGLTEDHLQCGRHPPFNKEAAKKLGDDYGTIHCNCSGKHAAMLAMSVLHGWSQDDYFLPEHPVQQRILGSVARICGLPRQDVGVGCDGCGVPVFFMPLYNMALGFARFCDDGYIDAALCGPLREAMVAYPEMVAGTGRIDTEVMKAVNGSGDEDEVGVGTGPGLVSKIGAEGLPCAGWSVPGDVKESGGSGMGFALKIEDGTMRAESPAYVECLRILGLLDGESLKSLEKFVRPPIKNFRKEIIGAMVTDISLEDFSK